MCLEGADQTENKMKPQNSTHEYQKDICLTEIEQKEMKEKVGAPIKELLESMKIEQRLKDILLYALGMINQNQDESDNG